MQLLKYLDLDAEYFDLQEDLKTLETVWKAEAYHAVIFHATRIFERILIKFVFQKLKKEEDLLFGALRRAEAYNILPKRLRFFGHTLRRLGNTVRHVKPRVILPQDAENALSLLLILLKYFVGRDENVDKHAELAELKKYFGSLENSETDKIMNLLWQEPMNKRKLWNYWLKRDGTSGNVFGKSPEAIALYAELLIETHKKGDKSLQKAIQMLEIAIEKPEMHSDLRLTQMLALAHSRNKDYQSAINVLGPKLNNKNPDTETNGILAGAYKRRYNEEKRAGSLLMAHELYGQSYEKWSDTYNGINYAATALYLDRFLLARKVSKEIIQKFKSRIKRSNIKRSELDLWDIASLGEANLIVGDFAQARRDYKLFQKSADPGNEKVAMGQLQSNLNKFLINVTPKRFLSVPVPDPDLKYVKIGITGHRTYNKPKTVKQQLKEMVAKIRNQKKYRNLPLRVITPLAEGADRLLLDVCYELYGKDQVSLQVAVPFEIEDYCADFQTKKSKDYFCKQLLLADRVTFPGPYDTRNQGYMNVGYTVADSCDELIAIWDGKPAQGYGGTAMVIHYYENERKGAKKKAHIIKVTRPAK